MVDMVLHQILPASISYSSHLAEAALQKSQLGVPADTEESLTKRISEVCGRLYQNTEELDACIKHVPTEKLDAAKYYDQVVTQKMRFVRTDADQLEELTAKKHWPYPTYSDILYY